MSSWVPGTEDDITPPVPPATRRVRDASGMDEGLAPGEDGRPRCAWGTSTPEYIGYHDAEWGFPVTDDRRLFEKICLEGFQSGLSWLTILRKREAFRRAFAGFDPSVVAEFGEDDVTRLLGDAGIIRHAGKIRSTINNARCALDAIDEYGSFAAYIWSFEPAGGDRPTPITWAWLRSNPTSPASVAMAKDLKRRGFSFVGPTTVYAFMQAMGLVNDHVEGCSVRAQAEAARATLVRPS
jgi:DNA-3-methyladenine glycosylase I